MFKDTVSASHFDFSYPNQTSFPPERNAYYFDCEAMAFYEDSLYLFTKNRTEPWDGIAKVYSLSTEMKTQEANFLNDMFMGPSGWWQDAITGAEIRGKYCYLMTYNRVDIYKIKRGKLKYHSGIPLRPITQKEGIAVNNLNELVVGDEFSRLLGGGFLFQIPNKVK